MRKRCMMDMYAPAAMAIAGFDDSISSQMQVYKSGTNKQRLPNVSRSRSPSLSKDGISVSCP